MRRGPLAPRQAREAIFPHARDRSKGFKAAKNKLKGRTEITAEVVDDALRDIRVSLLEADVSFEVVKRFVAHVREKAVGEVVETKMKTERATCASPRSDQFIKFATTSSRPSMGPVDTSLRYAARAADRHHDGRPPGLR